MFIQREGSTLKIELRRVASSQMFEANRQSIKNDDVVWPLVYVRSVLWRISDVLVIVRARMLKEANRNSCLCCSHELQVRSAC